MNDLRDKVEVKQYKNNKEHAYQLFDWGVDRESVAEELSLSINSIKVYYVDWKKERGYEVRTTRPKRDVAEKDATPTKIAPQESQDVNFSRKERMFNIGDHDYFIDCYTDRKDNSEWFDFVQIIESLKEENVISKKGLKTKIQDRYFRNETINNKLVNLIDKHVLLELSKEIENYSFTATIVNMLTNESKDVFYKFNFICVALEMAENFIVGIDKKLDEVKAFNTGQMDFLHEEIDNDPFATDEELLEKMKKFQALRLSRRTIKNELVLSQTLRSSFRYYKLHAGHLHTVRTKLSRVLTDLYQKKYNSRLEQLDEWQKEIVDKIISEQLDMRNTAEQLEDK